jgi:hypothetical protein
MDQAHAKTPAEFRKAKKLSRSSWFKLKRLGLAPDTITVPGTRIQRITAEAEAAWDQKMIEAGKSEAALLEVERRRAQATEAGKIAALSAQHISRRARTKVRARRRRTLV